jgi:hypothetical protein
MPTPSTLPTVPSTPLWPCDRCHQEVPVRTLADLPIGDGVHLALCPPCVGEY